MCKVRKYGKGAREEKNWKNQVNSSRIDYVQGFTGVLYSKCSFRMEHSCLESILTFVINPCDLIYSQKPEAQICGREFYPCRTICLFPPDAALKVWHQFPSAGTTLEVLYHSRLPRGQQSSTSWLSWLYSCVTSEEVHEGVIRGQEKAQRSSSRTAWRRKDGVFGARGWMQRIKFHTEGW